MTSRSLRDQWARGLMIGGMLNFMQCGYWFVNPPPASVYIDAYGVCRFSATGGDAPVELCVGKKGE